MDTKETKYQMVTFRATEDEFEAFDNVCKRLNQKRSEFLRARIADAVAIFEQRGYVASADVDYVNFSKSVHIVKELFGDEAVEKFAAAWNTYKS